MVQQGLPDKLDDREDVQYQSTGEFGNAVQSMAGEDVTVRFVRDPNSFSVGNRNPDPALEQYDWASDHVMAALLACSCHARFVSVSVTKSPEVVKRDVG